MRPSITNKANLRVGTFDLWSLLFSFADGLSIFELMLAVNACPKPVIGRVNGTALGGGLGLIACCDIVVAVDRANFAFSEVRLGVVPAVISPFVVPKIGAANALELFLTGERFDAVHAQRVGLVHHIVTETDLDTVVDERVHQLLLAAPSAQSAAKRLIRALELQKQADLRDYTVQLIAEMRASQEGREGMTAFLEKRKPEWQR